MDLGINLASQIYKTDTGGLAYIVPTRDDIDYFAAEGFTTIRLPFSWEALQPTLNGPLDQTLLTQIKNVVSYAAAAGINVILDNHNQAEYDPNRAQDYPNYNPNLIGSAQVPTSAFADFWSKLAGVFAKSTNVSFGLMNEPHLTSASDWLKDVNAAIAAIRSAGAVSQQVLVSGIDYDGAAGWTTSGNSAILGAAGAVVDPSHNYVFEVHQYLDYDGSGQHDDVASVTTGVDRLRTITAWAQQTGNKLYLGEVGVSSGQVPQAALNNMFAYMQQNSNVWQGAAYWAAGQGWSNYSFSVEPGLGLVDAPQLSVLKNYGHASTTTKALANGNVEVDTFIDGRAKPNLVDIYDSKQALVAASLFNAAGNLDRTLTVSADGTQTLSLYEGASSAFEIDTYDASNNLLRQTKVNADGSKEIDYHTGPYTLSKIENYAASGALTSSIVNNADGTHTGTQFNGGLKSVVQTFDASWSLTEQDDYSAQGVLQTATKIQSSGNRLVQNFDAAGTDVTITKAYTASGTLLSTTYAAPLTTINAQVLAADTGASATDGVTRNGAVTLSGTVMSGLATTVEVYDGKTDLGQAKVTANGTWSYATLLGEGAHSLSAVATDSRGTSGVAAGGTTIVVDTKGPALSLASASYSAQSGKVSLVGTLTDATAMTAEVYAGSTDLGAATLDSKGGWSYSGALASGSTNLKIVATDLAGNTASRSVGFVTPKALFQNYTANYDAGGVLASDIVTRLDGFHVANQHLGNGQLVIQTFNADWTLTEQDFYSAQAVLSSSDYVQASGNHVVANFDSSGTKVANVQTFDTSWNFLSYRTYAAPGISLSSQALAADTGASATDGITSNGAVTLAGAVSSALATTVEIFDGNVDLGQAKVGANGAWTYATTLGEGTHALSATATDVVGGKTTTASASTILVDTQDPTITITSELYSAATGKSSVTGTVSDATVTNVKVYADAAYLGPAILDGKGGWSYQGVLAPGSYNILAVATDLAGNTASVDPPLDVPAPVDPSSITLDYALAQEHLTYVGGQSYLTGLDGVAHDVTGLQHFVFTDGTINQNTGAGALVDNLYYDINNLDVWNARMDPTLHYDTYGWKEGRNPDAFFSTNGYLAANPDVAASGINPLTHYDQHGWTEGRDPSANFDDGLYLKNHPDVKAAGLNPLVHYLDYGQTEGRATYAAIGPAGSFTHGSFDAEYYLLSNPDVAKAALSSGKNTVDYAYQSYEATGWKQGRNPNAFFDVTSYLTTNTDVKAAGIDPLAHYDTYGWREGRNASPTFNTAAYETTNADVAAAHVDPLTHYLQYGASEGRAA